jgi:hypothetical protein
MWRLSTSRRSTSGIIPEHKKGDPGPDIPEGRLQKMFPKKSPGNVGLNYRPLLITSLTKSPTRLL